MFLPSFDQGDLELTIEYFSLASHLSSSGLIRIQARPQCASPDAYSSGPRRLR